MSKDGTDGMVSLIAKAGISTDHHQRIASCRLIVLPYLPESYCLRGSGVLIDASSTGRPTIASLQTSMGRMILAGLCSGLVFPIMDPDRIAEAVCDGLDRIDDLTLRARELRDAWSREHSTNTLLKQLLKSFQGS